MSATSCRLARPQANSESLVPVCGVVVWRRSSRVFKFTCIRDKTALPSAYLFLIVNINWHVHNMGYVTDGAVPWFNFGRWQVVTSADNSLKPQGGRYKINGLRGDARYAGIED